MRRRSGFGLAFGLVLALCLTTSGTPPLPVGFAGQLVLRDPQSDFGGFSAIEVSADGTTFLALTDRGAFVRGRMSRKAGHLTDVQFDRITFLTDANNAPLAPGRTDSEGLAVGEGGQTYVSFEGIGQIFSYARIEGAARSLPQHPDFRGLAKNEGLEAIALAPDGAVFAVPEGGDAMTIPVYRFRGDAWDANPLTLSRSDAFRPVAADFGPDGRLYLLERRFHGLLGFSSRLRRWNLHNDLLVEEQTLLQTPAGLHDNLEGLSVWRAPDGLRATMISDDNFFPLQVTEIVEYHLPD